MTLAIARAILLSLTCSLAISCRLLPLEEMPQPPAGWQIGDGSAGRGAHCQQVEGVYSSTSDALHFVDGRWVPSERSELRHYHLFVGPAASKGLEHETVNATDSPAAVPELEDWISFDLGNGDQLLLQFSVPGQGSVRQIRWLGSLEQFSCEQGRIVFPVQFDLGGGDGPDGNSQREVSMGASEEGSLVVYERLSLARASPLRRGLPKFWVYRFERFDTGSVQGLGSK